MAKNKYAPEKLTIFRPIQNKLVGKKVSEITFKEIDQIASKFPSPLKEELIRFFSDFKQESQSKGDLDAVFPPIKEIFLEDRSENQPSEIKNKNNNLQKRENANMHDALYQARMEFSEKIKAGVSLKRCHLKNYKLVKDTQTFNKLVNELTIGKDICTACAKAGISTGTYYKFKEDAANSTNNKIKEMLLELDHAYALGNAYHEAIVDNHAMCDPSTAKWRLANRRPDIYGDKQSPTVVVQSNNSQTINQVINIRELPPDEQKKKLEELNGE